MGELGESVLDGPVGLKVAGLEHRAIAWIEDVDDAVPPLVQLVAFDGDSLAPNRIGHRSQQLDVGDVRGHLPQRATQ